MSNLLSEISISRNTCFGITDNPSNEAINLFKDDLSTSFLDDVQENIKKHEEAIICRITEEIDYLRLYNLINGNREEIVSQIDCCKAVRYWVRNYNSACITKMLICLLSEQADIASEDYLDEDNMYHSKFDRLLITRRSMTILLNPPHRVERSALLAIKSLLDDLSKKLEDEMESLEDEYPIDADYMDMILNMNNN